MTVVDVLAARQAQAFGTEIQRLLEERGMSQSDLARRLDPRDDGTGKARMSGKISQMIAGRTRPTTKTVQRYAEVLGVDPAPLLALLDGVPRRGRPRRASKVERDPVRAANEQITGLLHDLPPPPPAAPQFALVVDQAGTASLTLNMPDVPLDVAMRVMGALTAAGLLSTGETEA